MPQEQGLSRHRLPKVGATLPAPNALLPAFFCVAASAMGAVVWLMLRPDAFLVAAPLFLLSAPLALALLVAVLRLRGEEALVLLLPLVLLAVDFNLRPGSPGHAGGLDQQSLVKALLYGTLALHGLLSLRAQRPPRGLVLLLLVYAVVAAASVFYADAVFLALGGGVALVAVALAAHSMSALAPASVERIWRISFHGLVALALVSLVLYIVLPQFAVASGVAGSGRLRGLTGAPNSLGPLMAVGILIAIYLFGQRPGGTRRSGIILAIALMSLALVLTGSRTAIGGLGLAVMVSAAASSALVAGVAIAAAGLGVWLLIQPHLLHQVLRALAELVSRSGQVFELTSFTGRVEIWRFSIERWLAAPWLGYGLGGPRQVISEGWSNRWGGTTGTAHNMLLESLMSVGLVGTTILFVGVALLLVELLKHYRRCERSTDERRFRWLLLALALFIIIDGCMEKSFAGLPSPQTIVLAMLLGSHFALKRVAQR